MKLFISLLFHSVISAELVSSIYYDKSIIFDVNQYNYRIYEAKFDDELFFVEHWTCPCAPAYSNLIADDFDVNNTIPVLGKGIHVDHTINEETVYYKFYVSDLSTVRIFISSHWGQLNGYVNVGRLPSNTDFLYYKYAKSRDSIWICPSEIGWSLGWWYIAVSRNEPFDNNHFTIWWDTVDFKCDPNPIYDKAGFFSYTYYSYPLNGCGNFSVSVKQTTLMYGDIDLYMSTNNSEPNIDNHEYASQNNGDDTITLIGICADTIYVGLYAWQCDQVPYVLTVSMNEQFNTRPIKDLPPQQFLYTMAQGQASLVCNNDIVRCEFFSYFGCLDPYDIWFCCGRFGFLPPQDDVSPWVVAPEAVIAKKYKRLHRTVFPSVSDNIPGMLVFVQYLNKYTINDVRQLTPNKVCSIKMNNMIVDSKGVPVLSIDGFIKRKSECNSTLEIPPASTNIDELALQEIDLSEKLSSKGIQGCVDKLRNYVKYDSVTRNYTNYYCQLTESDPRYYQDPCCSWNLTISEVCSPRLLFISNEFPVSGKQNNTDCMNRTIANYISKYRDTMYYIEKWKSTSMNSGFVYGCVNKLFGDFDLIGKPCDGICPCVLGRCNYTLDDLKECWWNAIHSTGVEMALFNYWDVVPPTGGGRQLFFEQLDNYIHPLCTGPGSLGFRSHYEYILSLPTCVDDCVRNNITVLCYDPSCQADLICPPGSATNCYRIFQYKEGDSNQCETLNYYPDMCLDCSDAMNNNGTCISLDRNETECEKGFYSPGYCSITNLTSKLECENYSYCDIQSQSYGPWLTDFYGYAFCPEGITNPWGCLTTTPIIRVINGCDTTRGCFDGSIFTYHNSSVCPYKWIPMTPMKNGIWYPEIAYPLIWRPAGNYSTRKIQNDMDYISFYNDVNKAIGIFISLEYSKKAIGRSAALLEILNVMDCNCYNISSRTQIDAKWVCPSVMTVLNDSYFNVTAISDKCSPITACYIPSNYYKLEDSARFSSQSFTDQPPNEWSIFYVNNLIIEGQLASDGVELNFTGSVELCIQPMLEESELFDTYAIVTIPYSIISHGLCANLSQPGIYFLVKIRSLNDSITIQSAIASAIYWILSIVCLYQIINVTLNKDITRRKTKLLSLYMTILFLVMRAVYFILLPVGVIGSYPATSYVFFELPTYLFVMINSSIVYLWIEVIRTIHNYGFVVGVDRKAQTLFLVWSIVILGCFSAFIAVFYSVSTNIKSECSLLETHPNDALIVSQAYVVFVAAVLILLGMIMIGFCVIVFFSDYTEKIDADIVKNIQLTWMVMCMSLLFSIIKSILMIIAVFDTFIMPVLVFTLLEQIPVGILLYYMRPRTKITLTTLSWSSSTSKN